MPKLKEYEQALDFKTADYTGSTVQLSTLEGSKVLLCFFRGAACPFCNIRLHQMIAKYPEWEKSGLKVIVFFASTASTIQQYAGRQQPPSPSYRIPQWSCIGNTACRKTAAACCA